jgi:hypothetical protein
MKFSTSVTLCPETHPRLHKALFPIRIRSRAEVIRRYAEIGLLFEMGMLNTNTSGNKMTMSPINTFPNSSNNEDNFDNDIADIFEMTDFEDQ